MLKPLIITIFHSIVLDIVDFFAVYWKLMTKFLFGVLYHSTFCDVKWEVDSEIWSLNEIDSESEEVFFCILDIIYVYS